MSNEAMRKMTSEELILHVHDLASQEIFLAFGVAVDSDRAGFAAGEVSTYMVQAMASAAVAKQLRLLREAGAKEETPRGPLSAGAIALEAGDSAARGILDHLEGEIRSKIENPPPYPTPEMLAATDGEPVRPQGDPIGWRNDGYRAALEGLLTYFEYLRQGLGGGGRASHNKVDFEKAAASAMKKFRAANSPQVDTP